MPACPPNRGVVASERPPKGQKETSGYGVMDLQLDGLSSNTAVVKSTDINLSEPHVFDLNLHRPEKATNETTIDADHPVQTDKLDLVYTGEMAASTAICPLLKRTWSQTICRGKQHGLLSRLPKQFDLLDRSKLNLLKDYWTADRERAFDQINSMALPLGVTEVGCDQHPPYCTAAIEVLPELLAVWTVWSDEKSVIKTEQMAFSRQHGGEDSATRRPVLR
jgi:hypothetical protein